MKGELEKCKIADDILIEAQNTFKQMMKKGIYKELYKRNLLSDAQLNLLLKEK